jgi:hypothetical protein
MAIDRRMLTQRVRTAAPLLLGLTAVVLIAAGSRAAAQTPASPTPGGTGLIVGQVVDGDSQTPIAGAVVSIQGPARQSPVLTTSDGYFLFRDLPPGHYAVFARKAGYTSGFSGQQRPDGQATAPAIALASDQRLVAAPVRLWRVGAISGTVLDEAGEPQVGVLVRALRRVRIGSFRKYAVAGTSRTDDRGAYRLGGLVPADYIVAVESRRTALPVDTLDASSPSGALTAAAGITAQATSPRDGATAAARGTWQGLSRAVYPTTFNPDARVAGAAQLVTVTSGAELPGVDVRLAPLPAFRLSGVVAGPTGPVAGCDVELLADLLGDTAMPEQVARTTTGPDGRFTFDAPAGQYEVRTTTGSQGTPQDAGLWWASATVGLGDGDVSGLTLTLREGLTISGELAFEGADSGPPGYQGLVAIQPADDDQRIRDQVVVRTTPRGEFTSPALPPGRYFVMPAVAPAGWAFRAAFAGGVDVSDEPLDLTAASAAGVTITFTRSRTSVSGVVRTAAGQSDPSAIVLLYPLNPRAWEGAEFSPRRLRSVRVNDGGGWTADTLPPGDYYVVALPDAEASGWDDPEVLLALSGQASRVSLREGDQRSIDLRTIPRR